MVEGTEVDILAVLCRLFLRDGGKLEQVAKDLAGLMSSMSIPEYYMYHEYKIRVLQFNH